MFSIEEKDKISKISCPAQIEASASTEFSNQAKAWLLKPSECYVLDLNGVTQVTNDFYRTIIRFKSTLHQAQKTLFTINVSANLSRQFSADGVTQVFSVVKGMEDVIAKTTGAKASKNPTNSGSGLDIKFINPFLQATVKTFEVQCQVKMTPGKPYIKKNSIPQIAIAGVLSLASKGYTGSVVICFPEKVFLKVYESMFGETHPKINKEVQDAASELLNIIYGMAKIELNQNGFDFQKALPTVLVAEQLEIRQSGLSPAMIIPFQSSAGDFHLEIDFNMPNGGNHV